MRTKLGVVFLGMMFGGATFLSVGFASFLTIAQLQYSTMQGRVAQAVIEANQVSTRAKTPAPVMADAGVTADVTADVTLVRYERISP